MTMRQGTIVDTSLIAAPNSVVTRPPTWMRSLRRLSCHVVDEENVALATVRLSEDPTAWLGQTAN